MKSNYWMISELDNIIVHSIRFSFGFNLCCNFMLQFDKIYLFDFMLLVLNGCVGQW